MEISKFALNKFSYENLKYQVIQLNGLMSKENYRRDDDYIAQLVYNISTDCNSENSLSNQYFYQQITGKIDRFEQFIQNSNDSSLKSFLQQIGQSTISRCQQFSTVRLGLPQLLYLEQQQNNVEDTQQNYDACYFGQSSQQLINITYIESNNTINQIIYSQPYRMFNLVEGRLIQLQQISFQINLNEGNVDYIQQHICNLVNDRPIMMLTNEIYADFRYGCSQNVENNKYCVGNSQNERSNGYLIENNNFINTVIYVSFTGTDNDNNKLTSEKDSFAYMSGFIKGDIDIAIDDYFQAFQDFINGL